VWGSGRRDEFEAKRVSFFPSLQLTLNHILLVEWFCLDGLEKGGRDLSIFESEVPFTRLPDLAVSRRTMSYLRKCASGWC
jgi:uncharacterized damage-inducible protein DinB